MSKKLKVYVRRINLLNLSQDPKNSSVVVQQSVASQERKLLKLTRFHRLLMSILHHANMPVSLKMKFFHYLVTG
jgi:hypothetical protein